ncbi:MAG: hypothetical protein C0424_02930 [Sphingobacteriaceae bacterium]|nr:hypothetical protein [Sphingobacteriaceae bacterium]
MVLAAWMLVLIFTFYSFVVLAVSGSNTVGELLFTMVRNHLIGQHLCIVGQLPLLSSLHPPFVLLIQFVFPCHRGIGWDCKPNLIRSLLMF